MGSVAANGTKVTEHLWQKYVRLKKQYFTFYRYNSQCRTMGERGVISMMLVTPRMVMDAINAMLIMIKGSDLFQ